jgi:protein-serine/threonine kinase
VEEKYGKRREVLGQGASGTVSLYRRRTSSPDDGRRGKQQQLYAVKAFSRRSGESAKQYAKRVMAEYCVASVLWHPNIVLTLDLLQDSSKPRHYYCQVMEFSAGGDLGAFIASSSPTGGGGALQVDEADCFFKQMVRGVEYIHEMGVAHRDLKPGNVLLTPRGAVKISDFGSAELLRHAWETESRMSFGLTGTTPYMAPEMFEGAGEEGYDARGADVWSCGVIYLAMRTGKQFWGVANEEDGLYRQFVRDSFGVGFGPIEELRPVRETFLFSSVVGSALSDSDCLRCIGDMSVYHLRHPRSGPETPLVGGHGVDHGLDPRSQVVPGWRGGTLVYAPLRCHEGPMDFSPYILSPLPSVPRL